jgi:uncharacterized protein (DUF2062 family)
MTGSDGPVEGSLKTLLRRLVSPVVKQLKAVMSCGLTPRKLALTLCIGTLLGILPLVWGTTLICVILAYLFRLNHVALQSVNYLLYPVQLVLLVPFFKLGERLFPWGPPVPEHVVSTLIDAPLSSLHLFGWITLKSIAAWGVTALPAALTIYMVLRKTAFRDEIC